MTCARGGQSKDEIVDALKAIRDSEEFADVVALRHHAGYSFNSFGEWLLDSENLKPASMTDLPARARAMVQAGT